MSFLDSSKILSIFKRNKPNQPVPIKKGTQLLDVDSNVVYEFDGEKLVVLVHGELSAISSSSDRDAIRRANERERACKSAPYSTAKEYPDNARRDISAYRSDDSTNDFTNQMLTAVTAATLSDYSSSRSSDSYSSSCSSYDSSSSSSHSSDSGSSYDSSSSSGCD